MAKPRPVEGITANGRLRPNARRILEVRIDEVWSYSDDVLLPGRVRQLHDMRIAFKRLRYLIEIFAVAFASDLDPLLDEMRVMQDLLGEIHDRDIQVPMLQAHLDRMSERDDEAARAFVRSIRPHEVTDERRRDRELQRFTQRLTAGSTVDQRAGILALVDRRSRERDVLYERFLSEWRRLEDEGFRTRLETALGIG